MGRLMPGPASSRPNPLEDIGSSWLNGGVGPGPKVPTMPPLFPVGEGDHPRLGKRIRLTVITWGTVYH